MKEVVYRCDFCLKSYGEEDVIGMGWGENNMNGDVLFKKPVIDADIHWCGKCMSAMYRFLDELPSKELVK